MVSPPKLTYRIGCIGHRPHRLTNSDQIILSKVISKILITAKEEVNRIWGVDSKWYSGNEPVIQIISSLAEGSDRLFAEEGIKLGYSLSCPMPFIQDEYEKDFSIRNALEPESLQRFRRILNDAQKTKDLIRFEMLGNRSQESQAYRSCGRIVLNQSDLLIVVWDGVSQIVLGGTEDLFRVALKLNIPVIWIDAHSPHHWMVLDGLNPQLLVNTEGRHEPSGSNNIENLVQTIKGSLALPGSGDPHVKDNQFVLKSMSDFYNKKMHTRNPAILWRIFSNILGNDFSEMIHSNAKQQNQPEIDSIIQGYENGNQSGVKLVQSNFNYFDRLSAYYGDFYRSGYILSFLLATVAVGLALFPITAGWLTNPNHLGETILVLMELLTLLLILLLVFRSRAKRWHGQWLDYRLAAEWIRQLKLLSPLGLGIRVQEARGHKKTYEHPSKTWMAWYIKSLERSLGLPNAKIDFEYINKNIKGLFDFVSDQKDYHLKNSKRNHLIEKRLHKLGVMLIGATVGACLLHLVPLLIQGLHWKESISHFLTFLCGFLPALGAALAGINNQGEFKSLSKTSDSMQREYTLIASELLDIQSEINEFRNYSDAQPYRKLKDITFRISYLMIEELNDWRITYHNRPMDLPV